MARTKHTASKFVRVTVPSVGQLSHLMQVLPAALAWEIAGGEAAMCPAFYPRAECSDKQFLIKVPPKLCSIEVAVQILKVWSEDEQIPFDVEVNSSLI